MLNPLFYGDERKVFTGLFGTGKLSNNSGRLRMIERVSLDYWKVGN